MPGLVVPGEDKSTAAHRRQLSTTRHTHRVAGTRNPGEHETPAAMRKRKRWVSIPARDGIKAAGTQAVSAAAMHGRITPHSTGIPEAFESRWRQGAHDRHDFRQDGYMATINCAYCGARTHMTPLAGYSSDRGGDSFTATFRCDACYRISIATSNAHGSYSGSSDHIKGYVDRDDVRKVWEPKSVVGREFSDVPAHIASPAGEAFECFSIGAFRGAVLLARAVIEASAKDRGVTKGTLFEKIDKLAHQGDIRAMLAEAAHEVRMAGNNMAHGDFATAEITEEDADEILGFMEDFLREMFEIPARVQRRKDRREASK